MHSNALCIAQDSTREIRISYMSVHGTGWAGAGDRDEAVRIAVPMSWLVTEKYRTRFGVEFRQRLRLWLRWTHRQRGTGILALGLIFKSSRI